MIANWEHSKTKMQLTLSFYKFDAKTTVACLTIQYLLSPVIIRHDKDAKVLIQNRGKTDDLKF